MRTDRLHKAGGGLITLIRYNITFTTTDIPSTINTHNTELQMVQVHINNTKHITIATIYIPPQDATSTHYKTADTDIQHCIQYITNIPHSVLTGDVNAHSTLWHSYIDDHRGQIIADFISNSDHITLNTSTPTRVPNTTLQQTSLPDISTMSNTLYNRTSCSTQHALASDHLPIITTINIRHDYRLQQNRCYRQTFQTQSLSSSQTTSRDAKPTQHIEITHPNNVNLKLVFHKVASSHPHYLTFTPQTYHHPVHRFRSWPAQTTSQVRVQPRNTYNHTYIKNLPGQNKTTFY